MAKNVHLVDVRVMDEQGRGRVDDIIAGLNYVVGTLCMQEFVRRLIYSLK